MTIADEFWEYQLKSNPTFATDMGRFDYNDIMDSYNIEQFNKSRVN